MYCYVIFGESDDKHTRKYLYKCDEFTPGDTVIVPVKNSQKIALVYNTFKTIPEGLGLLDNRIKTVIAKNTEIIERKEIVSYILAMIDEYKDGIISKEYFYYVVEEFVSTNKLEIPENSVLHSLVWSIIPDVCLFYVEEPGEASEKELNFWKELKDIEYQLRYGCSYREKDKRSINIITDPIELTDKYLKIELELERLIRKEIGEGGYMGFCHKYWWTKKNLLKEKYGIEWKSPVDMNPGVIFD